jgi:hypothetical protein
VKRIGVLLLETSSGFLNLHTYDVEDKYAVGQEFWWTDGNAGCDCNRTLALFDFTEQDLIAECGYSRIQLLSIQIEGVRHCPHGIGSMKDCEDCEDEP